MIQPGLIQITGHIAGILQAGSNEDTIVYAINIFQIIRICAASQEHVHVRQIFLDHADLFLRFGKTLAGDDERIRQALADGLLASVYQTDVAQG